MAVPRYFADGMVWIPLLPKVSDSRDAQHMGADPERNAGILSRPDKDILHMPGQYLPP